MSEHLTPLQVCERLVGPPHKIAAICQLHEKSVFPWRRPSSGRDAGDLPSFRHARLLLAWAGAHSVPLTADHLIWGAPVAEIEQLVSSPSQKVAAE